ncbi:hypothetical protein C0993_006722 [Termitomyces sp. T159_Od127]|nr:hypothetical protein C0993_006722 [Termitomyces sp. T159_Od127]
MIAKGLHLDSRGQDYDPLTQAMAPPPNESEVERQARLAAEREAQKRSDAIDEELDRQRTNEKKTKCIRILLLDSQAFRMERASWRAVIQLNVVRSVRLILHAITEAQAMASPSAIVSEAVPEVKCPNLSPEHLMLKMRLSPLQQVEETLLRKMTPGSCTGWDTPGELALNSLTPWKNAFSRLVSGTTRASTDGESADVDDPNDPAVILSACKDDINALWTDPTIKEVLMMQKIRLQEMGGLQASIN